MGFTPNLAAFNLALTTLARRPAALLPHLTIPTFLDLPPVLDNHLLPPEPPTPTPTPYPPHRNRATGAPTSQQRASPPQSSPPSPLSPPLSPPSPPRPPRIRALVLDKDNTLTAPHSRRVPRRVLAKLTALRTDPASPFNLVDNPHGVLVVSNTIGSMGGTLPSSPPGMSPPEMPSEQSEQSERLGENGNRNVGNGSGREGQQRLQHQHQHQEQEQGQERRTYAASAATPLHPHEAGARAIEAVLAPLRIPVFRASSAASNTNGENKNNNKKPFNHAAILAYLCARQVVASPAEVAVVGDRLGTDVLLARLMGGWSVWVRDGVTVRDGDDGDGLGDGDDEVDYKGILARMEIQLEKLLRWKGLRAPLPKGYE